MSTDQRFSTLPTLARLAAAVATGALAISAHAADPIRVDFSLSLLSSQATASDPEGNIRVVDAGPSGLATSGYLLLDPEGGNYEVSGSGHQQVILTGGFQVVLDGLLLDPVTTADLGVAYVSQNNFQIQGSAAKSLLWNEGDTSFREDYGIELSPLSAPEIPAAGGANLLAGVFGSYVGASFELASFKLSRNIYQSGIGGVAATYTYGLKIDGVQALPTPEPSTWLLCGLGLVAATVVARRRA